MLVNVVGNFKPSRVTSMVTDLVVLVVLFLPTGDFSSRVEQVGKPTSSRANTPPAGVHGSSPHARSVWACPVECGAGHAVLALLPLKA